MKLTDEMTIMSMRLEKTMKDKGLNGSQLAERVDVTRSAMSLFLRGKRLPGRMVLAKMADELSVTVDYLLGRSDDLNIEELLENPRIVRLVQDFIVLADQDQQRVLTMIDSIKQTDHTAEIGPGLVTDDSLPGGSD